MDKLKEFLKMLKQRGEYDPSKFKQLNTNFMNENVNKIMDNVLETITQIPCISKIKGVYEVYNVIRAISISCISAVFVYKALKLIFTENVDARAENKKIFGRLAYSLAIGNLSLPIIDFMIDFNNTLIKLLLSKFHVMPIIGVEVNQAYGFIVSVIILLLQLYCMLKILIQYWMRMSELVFTGVVSPVVFTMWINEQWSGILVQWWKRVSILIFTQFFQILVLVLYSMLISGLALSGTFNGICLAIGSLLLLIETPNVLSRFIDSTNNISKVRSTFKRIKNFKLFSSKK